MSDYPFELPDLEPGWVWLAGAGPGDPGLLTLLAHKALTQADVIVYDALVDSSILNLAGPTAVREFAGKRGGRPSPSQPDISERLVELAREGKRVLRLKGGDPFVFGRGGEEALALFEADIPFRVVPGITAAIGGLAYAGIPLTHRGINSTVTFLTGHRAGGDLPDNVDWESLSKSSPVLVIYMGRRHLGRIVERLVEVGRPLDEPVAIIGRGTLPNQRVITATLGDCAKVINAEDVGTPTMFIVGEVVRLREQLDWLSAMSGNNPNNSSDY